MKKEDTGEKTALKKDLFEELDRNLGILFTRYAGLADRGFGSDSIQAAQAAAMLARELRELHTKCEPK